MSDPGPHRPDAPALWALALGLLGLAVLLAAARLLS